MTKRQTVNSWVWDGTAPGIHLPKLSLGKTFIDDALLARLTTAGVIRVPTDVATLELSIVYWTLAAGLIKKIHVEEGNHHITGEYLRIGHDFGEQLTIEGMGACVTMVDGGLRCMGKSTKVTLKNISITSRKASSKQISRHCLLVDSGAQVRADRCAFVNGGGSGVCAQGTRVELKNCISNGNKYNGLFAVQSGVIILSETFEAINNGNGNGTCTSRGCQMIASGTKSMITGVSELGQNIHVVGNIVVEFDRCLGRNKSFVAPHTKEKFGGKVV